MVIINLGIYAILQLLSCPAQGCCNALSIDIAMANSSNSSNRKRQKKQNRPRHSYNESNGKNPKRSSRKHKFAGLSNGTSLYGRVNDCGGCVALKLSSYEKNGFVACYVRSDGVLRVVNGIDGYGRDHE